MVDIKTTTVKLSDLRPNQVISVPLTALGELLGNQVDDFPGVKISGVSVDSADIAPGELFVAIGGARVHGAQFALMAQSSGAVAVVTDAQGRDICLSEGVSIPVLVVDNPRALVGHICGVVYDHPDRKIKTFAVTGTNGKTTTTFMLRSILEDSGYATALIGTVEIRVGDLRVESEHTTMEAPVTYRILALAVEKGLDAAIVETSSHAMSLFRVAGLSFDAAGFLNLQHEHLDFHHDMESYFQAKARLFEPERCAKAVVCVDDEWGARLAGDVRVPVTTVSSRGGAC